MKTTTTKKTKTAKKAIRKPYELTPSLRAKMEKVLGFEDGEDGEPEGDEESTGKIANILRLWVKGFTRKDIVAFGFNRSTVYRQVGELEKYKKAPALQYFGHDLFEARIQRVMKAKSLSRSKAVDFITDQDTKPEAE